MNFIGVTVDPDSFYVHFANTRHMFEPVAVGGTSPPVQVYELYNGGARAVNYELDTEPLVQIQAVSTKNTYTLNRGNEFHTSLLSPMPQP